MKPVEDLNDSGRLSLIAALIAEKRRTRVQLALGNIDADAAEARARSTEAELDRQWELFRRSQIRSTSDWSPSV
jgi:hypothetical protein